MRASLSFWIEQLPSQTVTFHHRTTEGIYRWWEASCLPPNQDKGRRAMFSKRPVFWWTADQATRQSRKAIGEVRKSHRKRDDQTETRWHHRQTRLAPMVNVQGIETARMNVGSGGINRFRSCAPFESDVCLSAALTPSRP